MKIDRQDVYEKYGGKCAYCGCNITLEEMEVDHIKPKILYEREGMRDLADHIDNLNPSCHICNHYKRGEGLEGFRDWLLGELHLRIAKLPKKTRVLQTQKRIEYLKKICDKYNIAQDKPFDKIFYFERLEKEIKKSV